MNKIALRLQIEGLKGRSGRLGKSAAKTIGFLLLCGCLAGCGSSSTSNVGGNWQFTVKSSVTGNTYTGTASITQGSFVDTLGSGTERMVTGTVNFVNDPCATVAPLSGTISGSNVIFSLTEGGQPVSFTGNVNAAFTAMSGSYSSGVGFAPGCTDEDFGSWGASKS